MTELAARVREARHDPSGALILFHGRGADENDLYPLFDMLDPERALVGASPRGPLTLSFGGAHWYVVRRVGYPDPATFETGFEAAARWLDAFLTDRGIDISRSVLGGFSQGAVMAYSIGLGRGRPRPAGLLCLSGFIPVVEGFDLDLDGLEGYPVFIGHGSHDPVIEVEFGREAAGKLQAAGADVVYRESPLPHTIDPSVVDEAGGWLRRVLS